jgi:hypothetical protein
LSRKSRGHPRSRRRKGADIDATVTVRDVQALKTRSGAVRFVLVDDAGKEYTTFRPEIGEQARRAFGRRARIAFHEQQRGSFTNVYLDSVEPADDAPGESNAHEADEVAWKTAVDAAPWLLGGTPPKEGVEPDELFERLQPFKELVAEDIEHGGEEPEGDEGSA